MTISVLGSDKKEVAFNCDIDYILGIISGVYSDKDRNVLLANLQNISSARLAKKRGDSASAEMYKQKLISVTYNATFNGTRSKSSVKEVSGLVYLDYDSIDTASYKERMKMYPFVKACFISSGGAGVSVLAEVEGLTAYNFSANVLKVHNLLNYEGLEAGCRDIDRLAFLSHDNEIYVNHRVQPLRAIEPSFDTMWCANDTDAEEGLKAALIAAKRKYTDYKGAKSGIGQPPARMPMAAPGLNKRKD